MTWQRDLAREAATSTDEPRLRELASHRLARVRAAVATNPATPPDVLAVLVEDTHHLPRYAVTHNPSPAAVTAAMNASRTDVRCILAQRHDLDDDVYEALYTDPSPEVRDAVITSTDRPELVARAAGADDPRLRAVAAEHALCSDEDFERLSRDPDRWVRASAAAVPDRLTPEMVERLRRDRSEAVRWALHSHLTGSWGPRESAMHDRPTRR